MKAPGSRAPALAAAALLAWTAVPGASPALDPYRELARGPGGARLLAAARAAMEREEAAAPPAADSLAPLPPPPAALYVTLARGPVTRACVGQEAPQGPHLEAAVRALAAQALAGDRRRPPVRRDELPALRVVVAFAGPPEPVAHPGEVDPGRDGLLIESAQGRVAFLPGEARTVAWALREARRIGVLAGPPSAARFYRFEAVTLGEAVAPTAERKDSDDVP